MKTIEEKAKAYDETIVKLKALFNNANKNGETLGVWFNDFANIIPELKESEDERINKKIIATIHLYYGEPLEDEAKEMIAYLEKQGEQKPQGKSALEAAKEEKVDNQNCIKPANKIEPKFKVKYAGSEYNVFETKDIAGVTFYGIEDEPNHIDYVKADNCEIISGGYGIKENGSPYPTKPAVFSEQNPAWSEEDDKMFRKAIITIDSVRMDTDSQEYYQGICNWLISLKERVQLQNIAYYNPYKEVVESIAKMCKHYDNMDVGSLQDFYDNVKVKCKDAKEYDSLFPQSRWKPSDEQMKILNEVLNFAANHESPHWNDYIFGTLNNLIRQLKKL